ncbi:hypothetical protein VNO78_17483 [Psophocarpus tetragonolobus]|uniref:Uncharacterized protein n=1 Tax=Psophocarpus tetragonolobus TaxID=3891 RepID=A0AAN9SIE1_PSOTE
MISGGMVLLKPKDGEVVEEWLKDDQILMWSFISDLVPWKPTNVAQERSIWIRLIDVEAILLDIMAKEHELHLISICEMVPPVIDLLLLVGAGDDRGTTLACRISPIVDNHTDLVTVLGERDRHDGEQINNHMYQSKSHDLGI